MRTKERDTYYRAGAALYEKLRPALEKKHHGKRIFINGRTGKCAVLALDLCTDLKTVREDHEKFAKFLKGFDENDVIFVQKIGAR